MASIDGTVGNSVGMIRSSGAASPVELLEETRFVRCSPIEELVVRVRLEKEGREGDDWVSLLSCTTLNIHTSYLSIPLNRLSLLAM